MVRLIIWILSDFLPGCVSVGGPFACRGVPVSIKKRVLMYSLGLVHPEVEVVIERRKMMVQMGIQ